MRVSIVLGILAAVWSQPAAALETARELTASGASRLALARVEQLQPRDPGAARWAEWEALRMRLLVGLKLNDEALKRAAGLPANMPPAALRQCLLDAGRAALATGRGEAARAYTARVLWQLQATPEEARAARLLVIESHLAERQGDTAYRAMLRYQQDYRPLERGVAGRFVEALLDLGMDQEAVNWLGSLDEASPARLMLRLRTGLATPEATVGQARALLVKANDPGYWRVIAEAARRQKNALLLAEAQERALDSVDSGAPQVVAVLARRLWQYYFSAAQEAANQHGLLAGDDLNWADLAARRLGTAPPLARALYGHLARRGQAPATRHSAQLQLVFSLVSEGLDRAALRLFQESETEAGAIDPQARYFLGTAAEIHDDPATARRYWDGIALPPNVGAEEWSLRLAAVQIRSGKADEGVAALKRALAGRKALAPELVRRGATLARELLDSGNAHAAGEVFDLMLPLAAGNEARGILFGLGRIQELAGRNPAAADYFLRSALLADAQAPDALALQARFAAGINLARAGYKEDARAQFQWLLGNAKDPTQREAASRELSRL
jgi:hypothetical protein